MKNSLLLHLLFKANRMKGIVISFIIILMLSLDGLYAQTDNSLHFNSANKNYVSVADNDKLDFTNSSSYTLEAWIKVEKGMWLGGIISKYLTNGSNGYMLRLGQDTTSIGLEFDEMKTENGIITLGRWFHVAAVNSNGTRHLYLNGVEQVLLGTPLNVAANTDSLCIGNDFNERYFQGNIDEVRIWNVARTQAEIQGSMNSTLTGSENGLVAYYDFNQGTPGGDNTSITSLITKVNSPELNGTLRHFTLSGATSNFTLGFTEPYIYTNIAKLQILPGGTPVKPLQINSNVSWTLTADSWLNITPTSGTGIKEIVVTAAPNNTSDTITGEITISSTQITNPLKIGVIQYSADTIVYVNKSVSGGTGSGKNWTNAMTELSDALVVAGSNPSIREIWVAAGTYKPLYKAAETDYYDNPTSDRSKAFVLQKDVKLYGGFSGTETQLTDRNWKTNATVLSGDIGVENDSTDNTFHVVIAAGDLGSATLDGFTVAHGNADNQYIDINLNNSIIYGNSGGGIYVVKSFILINHCIITQNYANYAGGGIYVDGNYSLAFPVFSNCLITNNNASGGSGICSEFATPTVINSTFVNNNDDVSVIQTALEGMNSFITLQNTLVIGNKNLNPAFIATDHVYSSLIQGLTNTSNGNISSNGITADMIFTDFTNGDYTLKGTAPVINSGANNLYYATFQGNKDIEGNPRIVGNLIDIGACEYQTVVNTLRAQPNSISILQKGTAVNVNVISNVIWSVKADSWLNVIPSSGIGSNTLSVTATPNNSMDIRYGTIKLYYQEIPDTVRVKVVQFSLDSIIHVNKNVAAGGDNSGKSWTNAMKELSDALVIAKSNPSIKEIWVAAGTYYPLYKAAELYADNMTPTTDRNKSFVLVKDVKVFGGFAGTESQLAERNWNTNITILSGDIGTQNDSTDNVYNIVIASDDLGGALLDGFTITKGNADANPNNSYPPIIFVNNNLVFCSNGGGIFVVNSSLTVNHCTLIQNYANTAGGMGVFSFGKTASAAVVNCLFTGNTAMDISGIFNVSGNLNIINSTFTKNTDNLGVIYNSTPFEGTPGLVKIYNSIILGNNLGIPADVLQTGEVLNNLIQGLSNTTGNVDATGITEDMIFNGAATGDYTLKPGCAGINAGGSFYDSGIYGATDLAGNTRIIGPKIDLGAYERASYVLTPSLKSDTTLNIAALAGSTAGVRLISNVGWSVQLSAPWLSVDKSSLSGNDSITFTATVNPTASARNTTVLLNEASASPLIMVKRQAGMQKTGSSLNATTPLFTINVVQAPGTVTGTENIDNNFSLYPNPVVDKLYIQGLASNSRVTVIDISGRIVLTTENVRSYIDVSGLKSGIYLINISDESGNGRTGKFTKK